MAFWCSLCVFVWIASKLCSTRNLSIRTHYRLSFSFSQTDFFIKKRTRTNTHLFDNKFSFTIPPSCVRLFISSSDTIRSFYFFYFVLGSNTKNQHLLLLFFGRLSKRSGGVNTAEEKKKLNTKSRRYFYATHSKRTLLHLRKSVLFSVRFTFHLLLRNKNTFLLFKYPSET